MFGLYVGRVIRHNFSRLPKWKFGSGNQGSFLSEAFWRIVLTSRLEGALLLEMKTCKDL